jgi:ATP-binding cassette subfamily F protein 3
MLHVQNLTYRIAGRTLFEGASMHLPKGHKGAIVGRNGIGKSTLFRLILGEAHPDNGDITVQSGARVGIVAQEVPHSDTCVLDFVLDADQERSSLLQEADSASDPDRIAYIHTRLWEIDAYGAPARAAKILIGLGFDEDKQLESVSSFSGGWKARIALAAALFTEPDLLLLDEPTNHLDLEAAAWLENFLKTYPRTLLIVSHDRHFLNSVVDRIYHVSEQKITLYNGDYDFYEKTRRERLAGLEAERRKQEAQRAHVQKFVDRFRAKSSKAKQVQSRVKMLEKFTPLVTPADDPTLTLTFPEPENLAPPLLTLEKVSVGYDEKVILKNLNQRIDFEDRIALLGPNGNGKSTFAKLLAGELNPMQGTLQASNKLKVGFFHQHQHEMLNMQETAYDHMYRLMYPAPQDKIRARLGRFGFSRDKADVPVEKLSGGEKARLSFALISYASPQLLIMDEPTNHLDIETRESLVMAINEFAGAVILVSHDWHLLELTADRLWIVGNQTVRPYDGTLDDYRHEILSGKKDLKEKTNKRK